MREIKFGGKSIESGEWVYGSYVYLPDSQTHHIIPCGSYKPHLGAFSVEQVDVDPATVGQYTGLKDMHGKEIYEGDIVTNGKHYGQVKWMQGKCCFQITPGGVFLSKACRVIGNIHDNPELLKGDEV